MQQTQALAEASSFANDAASPAATVPDGSASRTQIWRGRVAVGVLLGVSVLGYTLALAAIDLVVKGDLSALF